MGWWRCHLTSNLGILHFTRWLLAITIGIPIAAAHRCPAFGTSPLLLLQQRSKQEQHTIGPARGKYPHNVLKKSVGPSRQCSSGRRGQCLMGIKGLTGYVNKFRGAVPVEELRQGDTLCVDGSGWMFRILEGMRVDHGGDYDLLHANVCRDVSRLKRAGVNLRVFMDGKGRKLKAKTTGRRRSHIYSRFANLHGYTLDGGGASMGPGLGPDRTVKHFPRPKMAVQQFYASLRSAGVEVVECSGEADQEVAKASADDTTGRTFAVAQDSDFFLFERCRYASLEDLQIREDATVTARIWTRARLAELCHISEEQVVEWALLMGNDYTMGLTAGHLRLGKGKPLQTLKWLRTQGPDFKIDPRADVPASFADEVLLVGGGGEDCGDAVDADGFEGNDALVAVDSGVVPTETRAGTGADDGGSVMGAGDSAAPAATARRRQRGAAADLSSVRRKREDEEDEREEGEEEEEEALAAEAALDFSRSLYALQPLDRFRDDDDEDAESQTAAKHKDKGNGGKDDTDDMADDVAESGGLADVLSLEAADGAVPNTGAGKLGGLAAEDKDATFGTSTTTAKLNPGSRKPKWTPSAGGRLGPMEAHLESMLLATPFGEAALEGLTRTLAQVEKEHGGIGGVRGLRGLAAIGVNGGSAGGRAGMAAGGGVGVRRRNDGGNTEEYYVEMAAIQTALWGSALGRRVELPDTVRVKWADVLLAIQYQGNLLDAYQSRGLDRASPCSSPSAAEVTREQEEEDPVNKKQQQSDVLMPLYHFHGPTFHALLNGYRANSTYVDVNNSSSSRSSGGSGSGVEGSTVVAEAQAPRRDDGEITPKATVVNTHNGDSTTAAAATVPEGEHANSSTGVGAGATAAAPMSLPIDAHRDEILDHVRNNRVTVIHGETGSGKSSRLPVMLVEDAVARGGPRARMFVSQPRRAATRALAQRVGEEVGDAWGVAMRLGHGVREGPERAEVTFATTGYIVRLIANSPEVLDSHTHLIIDEVHERSVDTDLLCFFAKRILETHPTLRLIVMSATISAKLVSNYYGVYDPPLFVGSKRFPVREVYVDELADELSHRAIMQKACASLEKATSETTTTPTHQVLTLQHSLAVQVARAVGSPGSAVLIFVPGMASILAIMDLFELIQSQDIVYKVVPFHSELPKEEMMAAFTPSGKGVVKVVVATNSAESSITLPDVDSVICLGSCKQMMFDERTQRCTLTPVWISKASAVQRAGRTGRVRPGTVYRLYSRKMGEDIMSEHGDSEIKRLPLDSLVLELKGMLGNSPVVPVLESTLEPPDTSSVDRSLASLHAMGFISSPDDHGELTHTGQFASGLGVDLQLGRMVALGGRLGVLSEAVALTAVLSAASTPFHKASHMVHGDPDKYNDIVGRSFMSQSVFDRGLYSDPLAVLRVLREYVLRTKLGSVRTGGFCGMFSLSYPRMEQLASSAYTIARRVEALTGEEVPLVPADPAFDPDLANVLRLLLAWTFPRNVIKLKVKKGRSKAVDKTDMTKEMEVFMQGHAVTPRQLNELLPTVYPGMKEISYESGSAVYLHMYQTPNRAGNQPAETAMKLWEVLQELSPAQGKGVWDSSVTGAEKDKTSGEKKEDSAAKRSLEHSADRSTQKNGNKKTNKDNNTKVKGKKDKNKKKRDGLLEKGEEACMEEGPERIGREADSDAVVGLVYAVTKKTNAARKDLARRGGLSLLSSSDGASSVERQQHERAVLPVGERRLCVVMSERFAVANGNMLRQWGCNNNTRVPGVDQYHAEGVGNVITFDVPRASTSVNSFRAFMMRRRGGAYAVTDAPMVQVEISGDREVWTDQLPDVFGVDSSFEGGRVGKPCQVVKFAREDNHAGDCVSLVQDAPLGARVLAAIANGSRKRKLKLWSDESRQEKVEIDLSVPRNIWIPQDMRSHSSPVVDKKDGRRGGSGKGGGKEASAKRGHVFAPPYSVAASLVYQGTNRYLYAVASTIMHLPQANAVSDGLTLLPPGRNWLFKALLCSGSNVDDVTDEQLLTEDQISKASRFADQFWTATPEESREKLHSFRAQLSEIFSEEITHPGYYQSGKKDNEEGFAATNGGEKKTNTGPLASDVSTNPGTSSSLATSSPQRSAASKGRRPGRRTTAAIPQQGPRMLRAADPAAAPDGAGVEFFEHEGSPLARLKMPDAYWKGGPSGAFRVRAAEVEVGRAAAAATAGGRTCLSEGGRGDTGGSGAGETAGVNTNSKKQDAAVSATAKSGEAGRGKRAGGGWRKGGWEAAAAVAQTEERSPSCEKMSPELGRALVEWSGRLKETGREMASLMALQALVMGIMNVHRQNVRAEMKAAGEERPGQLLEYGNLARLEADLLEATRLGRAIHLMRIPRIARARWESKFPAKGRYGVIDFLRGVPWLVPTDADGGSYAWHPPAEVAAALDADPDNPTSWMTGIGNANPSFATEVDGWAGEGKEGLGWKRGEHVPHQQRQQDKQQRRQAQQGPVRHPCLQQFEAYMAHRHDVDLASALHRERYFRTSLLLLGRIVASAAMPDGPPSIPEARTSGSIDGQGGTRRRRSAAPLPEKSSTAMSDSVAAEFFETRVGRNDVGWSKQELVSRFEDLAGLRVTRGEGRLSAIGMNVVFDRILSKTPGLTGIPAGGWAGTAALARGGETKYLAVREKARAEGEAAREWTWREEEEVLDSGNGSGDGAVSRNAPFEPRFEAARFLVDVAKRQRYAARKGRDAFELGRGICLRADVRLLAAATIKRRQETARKLQRSDIAEGVPKALLVAEMRKLAGHRLQKDLLDESLALASGCVSENDRGRYEWAWDGGDTVKNAIRVAGGGDERGATVVRDYFTRAFNLTDPSIVLEVAGEISNAGVLVTSPAVAREEGPTPRCSGSSSVVDAATRRFSRGSWSRRSGRREAKLVTSKTNAAVLKVASVEAASIPDTPAVAAAAAAAADVDLRGVAADGERSRVVETVDGMAAITRIERPSRVVNEAEKQAGNSRQ